MRIVTVKNDKGIYIPPFMSDFTKEDSDLIGKLWDISTKHGYIADSLGGTPVSYTHLTLPTILLV